MVRLGGSHQVFEKLLKLIRLASVAIADIVAVVVAVAGAVIFSSGWQQSKQRELFISCYRRELLLASFCILLRFTISSFYLIRFHRKCFLRVILCQEGQKYLFVLTNR